MRLRTANGSRRPALTSVNPYESPEKPKRRVPARLVAIGILLLLVAFFGGRYLSLIWTIDSIGVVHATTVEVATPVAGRLADLRVRENASVRPGDLVARIEDPSVESDRRAADIAIAAARERLAIAEKGEPVPPVTRGEIDAARAEIDADEAAVRKARGEEVSARRILALREKERQRAEDLVLVGAATLSELETARREETVARGAAEASSLEAERLEAARERSKKIVAALADKAEGPIFREAVRRREAEMADARRQIVEAEEALRRAEARHSDLELRATRCGIVSGLPRRPGENLRAGEVVARLSDPTEVWVELWVRIDRARAVFEGTRVELIAAGYGKVQGVVESFFPEVDQLPLPIRNPDRPQERYSRAKVRLEGGNVAGLSPGQVLEARVLRAEH